MSLRRLIGADNDLFVGLVQGIKGMEEFLLHLFFAGDELDVVDDQHVGGAVVAGEIGRLAEAQGVDEFLHELLGRYIEYLGFGIGRRQGVADGLDQVGFADTDAAVQEEGIIFGAGLRGDRLAGGKGQLVAGADHEIIESVAFVEALAVRVRQAVD